MLCDFSITRNNTPVSDILYILVLGDTVCYDENQMRLQLINKSPKVDDVWTFSFRPSSDLTWLAGQSIRLELPAGLEPQERRFSISSTPDSGSLDITTRLSDSMFKKALAALKPGDEIDGFAVEGDFIWKPGPKVFVAAGIGITPFYAMLCEHRPADLRLVYAGRSGKLVFEDELRELAAKDQTLKLKFIHGRQVSVSDIAVPTDGVVYLSGPEAMIRQLASQLTNNGLDVSRIKTDLFTGRPGWDTLD